MWKDYSSSFIRKNRSSSVSIMVAALIATFFLSLLCSIFYNIWIYDIEEIVLNEGDWQGRIIAGLDETDILFVNNISNVEKVVVKEKINERSGLSDEEIVSGQNSEIKDDISIVDIYFQNPRTIYKDMRLIADGLGLEDTEITYNYQLLSMYFIRIPNDPAPRLILPFYAAIVFIAAISLVVVIHNSFAVSMNARIKQLGILSGIGATPGQICSSLIQEAAVLCIVPIVFGTLLGVAGGFGAFSMMDLLAGEMTGRHDTHFRYHPYVLALTILISLLTVLISAWIPAGKLAKLTPLEAVRGNYETAMIRRKHSRLLFLLFGIEGELAGNSLKSQKKALRTSALSLTLSFFGFTIMLCFFKLSDISTSYTYFARYQDVWDVMATVKDVRIEEFDLIEELKEAENDQGADSCVIYQKLQLLSYVNQNWMSEEVDALGGLETLAGVEKLAGTENLEGAEDFTGLGILPGDGGSVGNEEMYCIEAPIVILDDEGFIEYCCQAGIEPALNGAVIINRIWDSINSNFRYPKYIPFVKEDQSRTILQKNIEIPVLGYTQNVPVLREEYDDYALVHVMPLSLWKNVSKQALRKGLLIDAKPEVYIRILGNMDLGLEETAAEIIRQKYEVETENRIQKKITNDRLIWGYKMIVGAFCALLAIIGIANVFSYTMGFLRLRRREFARYASVGMTPGSMKKMFFIEIMVIAGRPVLITLPLTVIFTELMIEASYLNPREFWMQAPYIPVFIFIIAIFGFVALGYYIGGKQILRSNLAEALRSEI
ncbi:MAG: ABC transporter permease [Lachnospiraceae bacterium]|nr:ABC transporter permease [Lachnospiraceae bacterium]